MPGVFEGHFAKYEGLGNDFVLVDAEPNAVSVSDAVRMCDRRHGIGGDGVLVVSPDAEHEARMRVINADGSVPEMCGNGIRCVALHLALTRAIDHATWTIATDAGPRTCVIDRRGERANVRVDMGAVRFKGDREIDLGSERVTVALADAGNPHAILFGVDPARLDVLGPRIATHAAFPSGTNVEIATVHGDAIHLVVWERGVGRTLACGTGACATAVVAKVKGLVTSARVRVALPGGDLEIEPGEKATFMTGPARLVFRGATRAEGEP